MKRATESALASAETVAATVSVPIIPACNAIGVQATARIRKTDRNLASALMAALLFVGRSLRTRVLRASLERRDRSTRDHN
jgi:hypothetical protein